MKKVFFVLLFFISAGSLCAQSNFQRVYGGPNRQFAYKGCRNPVNGGFCITGLDDVYRSRIMLSRPDNNGSSYGINSFLKSYELVLGTQTVAAFGTAVTECGAAGYAVTGYAGDEMFFMLLDPAGNVINFISIHHDLSFNENPRQIIYTRQQTWIIVGDLVKGPDLSSDIFITEIDQSFNINTWLYDLHPTINQDGSDDRAYDVIQDPWGGNQNLYYVVGSHQTRYDVNVYEEGTLLAIDMVTGTLTGQFYNAGQEENAEFFSIDAAASNQGFVIGGWHRGKLANSNQNFLCLLVNANKTVAWQSEFDYSTPGLANVCNDIKEHFYNGSYNYYATGPVTGGSFGADDIQLLKLDASGNGMPAGEITIGGVADDDPLNLNVYSGGIYISGQSSYFGTSDHYLARYDLTGSFNIFCQHHVNNPVQMPVNLTLSEVMYTKRNPEKTTGTYTVNTFNYNENTICFATDNAGPPDARIGFTGIEEHEVGEFNVYPNPFDNKITVNAEKIGINISSVEVFNQLGQSIYKNNDPVNVLTVNTGNWNKGVYFLKIVDFDHAERTYKMIK